MPQSTLYSIEQHHWQKKELICGIDEVGRGCLAGPIVTCAVILHENVYHPNVIDSKKLSQQQLQTTSEWLQQHCIYAIALHSARIIDQQNIYQATIFTMKTALYHMFAKINKLPSLIVVDAMPLHLESLAYQHIPIQSFIKGESKSASIAAASIIAKVARDAILKRLHNTFPAYQLNQHKGYATSAHHTALQNRHASIIHRQSFLKKFLLRQQNEQQSIFC